MVSSPFEIIIQSSFLSAIELHFNEFTNTVTGEKDFFEKTLDEGVNRTKSLYDGKSVQVGSLTVGGRKAVQISGVYNESMRELAGRYFADTLVQMDGYLLIVSLHNKDFNNVYDQILSTLSF